MAATLGVRVQLCTALGGESGKVLAGLLAEEGRELVRTDCSGANGAYVHDRRGGRRRTIVEIPGAALSRHELDDLYGKTMLAALRAGVLVLTGAPERAIPRDTYRRLATDARENGIAVVADLTGQALAGALEGGVSVLKISDEALAEGELAALTMPDALRELHERGAENVIISRAEAGALALVEGEYVEVIGPRLMPADHHGAGDSMTAASAVGIACAMPASDWLRLAVAAGAVNAMRHGLGTGAREEIDQLAERVEMRALSANAGG
jgi:1-phosphofructokinase